MKPRLLDLFCGAGGAAMGYHRAGFEVVGVDLAPQPHYPFEFHQADAMAMEQDVLEGCWHEGVTTTLPGRLAACLGHFDAIHASPPCQKFTSFNVLHAARKNYVDLLTPMRERLLGQAAPWVIENVPGAPMRRDVILCGSQFGLGVRRHRWFEVSWSHFTLMHPCDHGRVTVCVVGHGGSSGKGAKVKRWRAAEGNTAMDIDWMTRDELTQAIPPAYTEFIGTHLMTYLQSIEGAA